MRSAVVIAALAGCATGTPGVTTDAGPPPPPRYHVDAPLYGNPALDVLFVIDNSDSMVDEQAGLARAFPAFVAALDQLPGGRRDLHLGVVSSNMGTLGVPTGDPACTAPDGGALLAGDPSRVNPCPMLAGAYLSDVDDGAGGRRVNYQGSLADAFACAAALGTRGCGFEQPLAAMRAALDDHPANTGFLRRDAALAVVVIADEDDCSAADPQLFAPAGDVLGALDSFRCFEQAIACDQGRGEALRAPGAKTGCRDGSGDGLLHRVDEYVEFLRGLKADPEDVLVAGLIGQAAPVIVGARVVGDEWKPRPVVEPSCMYLDPSGAVRTADPAIRLAELLAGFPHRNAVSTICNADYTAAVTDVAAQIAHLDDLCLAADIQVPADCTFSLVTGDGSQTLIPECDGDATQSPCWRAVADPARCGDTPSQLAIEVERTVEPAPDTRVVGNCRM